MRAVDEAIMVLISNDAPLGDRFDILVSIPDVSKIAASTLLIEMPGLVSRMKRPLSPGPVLRQYAATRT